MRWINLIGGLAVDGIIYPFRGLAPVWSLTVLSALTGLLFLMVFKWTSNQEALHQAKQRLKAHLLELVLYSHDIVLSLRAQKDLFLANLRYLRCTLKPILVLIVPVVLLLIQLDVRYGIRPFEVGETPLVRVRLSPTVPAGVQPEIHLPEGLALDAAPLYIPTEREIDWRLRIEAEGDHEMRFSVQGDETLARLRVGERPIRPVSPEVSQPSLLATLEQPGAPPLEAGSPIESISLDYPARDIDVFGWKVHWLVFFFVMSVVPAYLVKGLFGVEV
jgi:uncharacterized membrane protein (DUF106 family)